MKDSVAPAALLACLAWSLGSAGCNPYGAYCEDRMYCLRGNDLDVEACTIDLEAEEERADLWGCSEAWEALQECREEFSVCDPDERFTDHNRCDVERERYNECMP